MNINISPSRALLPSIKYKPSLNGGAYRLLLTLHLIGGCNLDTSGLGGGTASTVATSMETPTNSTDSSDSGTSTGESGLDVTGDPTDGTTAASNSAGETTTVGTTMDMGSSTTDEGPICGDGMIEGDEVCEGKDLGENPMECENLAEQPEIPYVSGDVSCDDECQLNLNNCSNTCGVELGRGDCSNALEDHVHGCCDEQVDCLGEPACIVAIDCLNTGSIGNCDIPTELSDLFNCQNPQAPGTTVGAIPEVMAGCLN